MPAPQQSDGEIEGGAPALIPPGEYVLRFDGWTTVMLFGRSPKVVLHFAVMDQGDYFETRLARWYNAKKLTGKPGRKGKFQVAWSSDLFREYVAILGARTRTDRIALSHYTSKLVLAKVETVTTNSKQQQMPEALHYSVIREILREHT